MKASRLLQRLDAAITDAKSSLQSDCLRAERAVYLLRIGRSDEAAEVLASLHRHQAQRPRAQISVWLNLAEGLAIYFADMGAGAYDKVHRAQALSSAMALDPLRGLTAAWLSQLAYVRHDVEAMACHLRESLRHADKTAHSTRSRAALVAAQALHQAGRPDLASAWHRRAREHALEDGDDATLSALLHNMAWLQMAAWRQQVLTDTGDAAALEQHALIGAESAAHYDQRAGISSLFVLQPLLQAQILSLQGKASQALKLYEHERVTADTGSTTRLQSALLSDQAWCYLKAGKPDAARTYALLSETSLTPATHVDDRAATHSRLGRIHAELGDAEATARHQSLATRAWAANAVLQARVLELIGTLSADE